MSASMPLLSIVPMPAERVPGYFSHFAEWYAEALADLPCIGASADATRLHAHVASYLRPYLGRDGLPAGTIVFDIVVHDRAQPVGATWCGEIDLGFGPLFYVHDLRIFAPWRRQGYAKEALATIHDLCRASGRLKGVGLSVLVQNSIAHKLYVDDGFVPLSQVLIKSF